MSHNPHEIANLITEDPDVPQQSVTKWPIEEQMEAEELPIDGELYYVIFTIGAVITPGEKLQMYDRNGTGNPGSDPGLEWEIISIDEVTLDEESDEPDRPSQVKQPTKSTKQEVTTELENKVKQALYKVLNDDMVAEHLGDTDDSYDGEEADVAYDRQKDEPRQDFGSEFGSGFGR